MSSPYSSGANLVRYQSSIITLFVLIVSGGFFGCSTGGYVPAGGYVPVGYRPEPPKTIPAHSYSDHTPVTQIDTLTVADIVAIRQVKGGLHVDVLIESGHDLAILQSIMSSRRSPVWWELVNTDDPNREVIVLSGPMMDWRWSPSANPTRYTLAPPSNFLYELEGSGQSNRFLLIMPHATKSSLPVGRYRLTPSAMHVANATVLSDTVSLVPVFEKDIVHNIGPCDRDSPLNPGRTTQGGAASIAVRIGW